MKQSDAKQVDYFTSFTLHYGNFHNKVLLFLIYKLLTQHTFYPFSYILG